MSTNKEMCLTEIRDILNCSDWSKNGILEILNMLDKKEMLGDCYDALCKTATSRMFLAWRNAYEERGGFEYEGQLMFTEARILEYFRNEIQYSQEKSEEVLEYIRVIGGALTLETLRNLEISEPAEATEDVPAEDTPAEVPATVPDGVSQEVEEKQTDDSEADNKLANEVNADSDDNCVDSETIENKKLCERLCMKLSNQWKVAAMIGAVILVSAVTAAAITAFCIKRWEKKYRKENFD